MIRKSVACQPCHAGWWGRDMVVCPHCGKVLRVVEEVEVIPMNGTVVPEMSD